MNDEVVKEILKQELHKYVGSEFGIDMQTAFMILEGIKRIKTQQIENLEKELLKVKLENKALVQENSRLKSLTFTSPQCTTNS